MMYSFMSWFIMLTYHVISFIKFKKINQSNERHYWLKCLKMQWHGGRSCFCTCPVLRVNGCCKWLQDDFCPVSLFPCTDTQNRRVYPESAGQCVVLQVCCSACGAAQYHSLQASLITMASFKSQSRVLLKIRFLFVAAPAGYTFHQ